MRYFFSKKWGVCLTVDMNDRRRVVHFKDPYPGSFFFEEFLCSSENIISDKFLEAVEVTKEELEQEIIKHKLNE